MRKTRTLLCIALVFLACQSTLLSQIRPRNAGVGIRGTFWRPNHEQDAIVVRIGPGHERVETGDAGGAIYFFSRLDNDSFMEFTIGAVGNVLNEEFFDDRRVTDISAIIPVTLGMRYTLVDVNSRNALRPYFSFGGGPYWLATIRVNEDYRFEEEEVIVKTRMRLGGYAGGGMNFLLSSNFGFNFDLRYHFIEFNKKHPGSGFEYGLGLVFQWGRYRSRNHSHR